MHVFISHKREDSDLAAFVASRLRQKNHSFYLDVVDSNIDKGGDDLGEYLRTRLGECDSLLAILSDETIKSWWVPWEIGVATEKDYPLSTFVRGTTTPPEYLRKWPVLRTPEHVDQFAALLPSVPDRVRRLRLFESKSEVDARRLAVSDFHRQLKQSIGQRG